MRKGREMAGLPVIALAQAERVGVVRDLVVDLGRRAVVALLLADTAQQTPDREVLYQSVRRVGPDAVMIDDRSSVTPVLERPQASTLREGATKLSGLQVLTEEGRTVGTVADVVLDERSGRIEQYEISAGALRDVVAGRLVIPASAPRAVGREYMIVPESVLPDGRRRLEEGPPLVMETPPGQFVELHAEEMERLAAELVIQQEDLVLGMRSSKTITNEDAGGTICFEGEPITQEIVQRARDAGKLNLLVQAAGEPAVAAMARGLAEQYALVAPGRMAARTVRTSGGEVLVSQGDVVTEEVVSRAREAGVLDQLMEAVRTPAEEASEEEVRRTAARSMWRQLGGRLARLRRRG